MIQKSPMGGVNSFVKSKSYIQQFFKISLIYLSLFFISFNVKAEETNVYTAMQVENLCIRLKSIFAGDINFSNNKEYKSCIEFSCECYDSNPESIKQVIFAMDICDKKFKSYKESLKQKQEDVKNETSEHEAEWFNKKIEDYTETDAADYINSRHLYDGKFSCTTVRELRWTCENDKYTCSLFGLKSQPNNPPKYKCDPIISKQSNDIFSSLEKESSDDSFEKLQDEMDNFSLSHLTGENKKTTEIQIAIDKFLNIRGEGGHTSYKGDGNGNFTVIHNGKTTKVHVDENNNVTLLEQ